MADETHFISSLSKGAKPLTIHSEKRYKVSLFPGTKERNLTRFVGRGISGNSCKTSGTLEPRFCSCDRTFLEDLMPDNDLIPHDKLPKTSRRLQRFRQFWNRKTALASVMSAK